jgi:membrane dipeptidase
VPDSILRLLAQNGGVVMTNFAPDYVSESLRMFADTIQRGTARLRAAGLDSVTVRDSVRSWRERGPKATLAQVADHVEHLRQVAGVDHVGIGSDFDGISSVPVGLEDVSKFPDLLAELLRRGWTDADVKKVAGLNVLRVLRDADRVATELRAR